MSSAMTNELKAQSLAEFLEIDVSEIEYDRNDDSPYAEYKTPEGTYTVMAEYEADKACFEYIQDFIAEMGIKGFTDNFQQEIMNHYLKQDLFEEICIEDYQSYASDIADESGSRYESRLIDECVDAGIITEEELTDNGTYEGPVALEEALADHLVDDMKTYYKGNLAQWYSDNFGEEALMEVAKENPAILDVEGITKECIRLDGHGHNLASWDGATNEIDNGFLAFKQNEYDERTVQTPEQPSGNKKAHDDIER